MLNLPQVHPVRRYPGTRWHIVFGAYAGVEQFAVNELQRAVQAHLPYVVQVWPADGEPPLHEHQILAGTAANHRLIREMVDRGVVRAPQGEEGYTIACVESPFAAGKRALVIVGADARGVLYGVEELSAQMLGGTAGAGGLVWESGILDQMPDFAISEAPAIARRGLWTWGYVIYDYRGFLDHMARLKLNRLVMWNDCPPLNAGEVIRYAHERGVEVILGFHWGWGFELELGNPEHRQMIKEYVLRTYLDGYRGLGMDGIYFQTLTEHSETTAGGQSTAALTCEMVNSVARALLEEEPELYIQFGLHATSIRERYPDLAGLDKRITMVWEDAGVIPYAYDPVAENAPGAWPQVWDDVSTPEGTLAYSQQLATLRMGTEFGMVPKGWTWLRWAEEFEHHGPFILGEREPGAIRRRLAERQARWDRVNALWQANYRYAARFYREMVKIAPRMTVTGLVEDGEFEAAIQTSVALFAEMLWDPQRNEEQMLQRAVRLQRSRYHRSRASA
jgi:hypothetical protein